MKVYNSKKDVITTMSTHQFWCYLFISLLLLFNQTNTTLANQGQPNKIAVVDLESTLEHSVAVQNIRKTIDTISAKMHQEMSTMERLLKQQETELIKERGILSPEEFTRKNEAFNNSVSNAQALMRKKKHELEQMHANAMSKVYKTTIEIIGDIAKKRQLSLVLPSTQVLFVDNELNITLEVIDKLNAKLQKTNIMTNTSN